jgi:SnoaL-like domain
MPDQVNFADCYVLTNQRTHAFLLSFLNHFLPQRETYAPEFEVPQHSDSPQQVFTEAEDLIAYLESHPNEVHAIYWENKETSQLRAAMCLFTSDGQVMVGLTSETHYPDTSVERRHLKQLEQFCNSRLSLIEYDTPAAKDTKEFLLRIEQQTKKLIERIYDVFNMRDIPSALQHMVPDVQWPNGWEGGYVYGRDAVSDYWTRQWKEIDPHVQPLSVTLERDGSISVLVQQNVKDKEGKLLYEGQVTHVYTLEAGLIKHMRIENSQ